MASDFAWLSNNLDIAYPFRTPAPVFDLGGVQTSLGSLVADATIYTSIEDEVQWKLYSIDLTFLWPNPPVQGTIRVQSDGGHDITLNWLHTDTDFNAWIYGRWLVTEWVKIVETPAGFTNYDFVVRILWSMDALDALAALSKSEVDWVDSAWFENKIVRQGPQRVRRVFYKIGAFYFPLGSELRLAGGFNTDIDIKQGGDDTGFRADDNEGSTVRPETQVNIAMPPGGGTGKYLRCAPNVLRTINGLGPDSRGNVHLAPKDCYWLERPLLTTAITGGQQVDKQATVYPNRLKLNNSCEECCSCASYVEVYENLERLWTLATGASTRIYQMLDDYKALRLEYLARTKGGQMVVKGGIVSSPGFSLNVAALIVNGGSEDIASTDELIVTLSFITSPIDFGIEYVDKTGLAVIPSGVQQSLDPNETAANTFELLLTGVALAPGHQFLWMGQFTANYSSGTSRTAANITLTEQLTVAGVLTDTDNRSAELKAAEERT